MNRAFYSESINVFLNTSPDEIIGIMATNNTFSLEVTQRDAWKVEIDILKTTLQGYQGTIYFEFSIPRMGQRIDVLIIIGSVVLVFEFKVGETKFESYAHDQVMDYALDLKNFHKACHNQYVAPILIATHANNRPFSTNTTPYNNKLLSPIYCNASMLKDVIQQIIDFCDGTNISMLDWERKDYYCPTPTIVEAAMALYRGHSVDEISRSDADAINLSQTTNEISSIIEYSKSNHKKSICFVTGVPGAGKTLVGLDIATKHIDKNQDLYSVFLSGNGPLVKVLREALTRDRVRIEKDKGKKVKKGEVMSEVKMFIQNVHNFRDDGINDVTRAPIEHIALFDEAQRAWDVEQTSNFMKRKKNVSDFNISEPEFLISCLNRHQNWGVIVCLVGGGQEINTGEAGISEWIDALNRSYPDWDIYISPRLTDSEYATGNALNALSSHANVFYKDALHLSVSMRSFRAEHVSLLIKQILDLQPQEARITYEKIKQKYPIVITRDLSQAKEWLRQHAQGTERYGIVVSSQAERLKPLAIDVRYDIDPINWFLNGKDDIRSSYYLEDVATEFDIQGLELDWACVTWDADMRLKDNHWDHWSFKGSRWQRIKQPERQNYQKNAYRVLLTRARQGMVIVVPHGDKDDPTRNPAFYDPIYEYLNEIGLETIDQSLS